VTTLALTLVLGSALIHATWNLLAKRASGGAAFVWWFGVVEIVLYAPPVIVVLLRQRPTFDAIDLAFIAGSGLLHLGYFLSLQRGYRSGDLSLVYPLARGSGPVLAIVASVLWLGERPTTLALSGAALIVISAFVISGGRLAGRRSALGFALLTGVFIASYTVWDGFAMRTLSLNPLLFMWGGEVVRALLLTPLALARRSEIGRVWREHRREVFGVALLSPLAYLLVLSALTFTPVSYVAPARELSILVGTLMGARLLAEGEVRRRLGAASTMVLGVVMLALG
jgi:drug/metabolite transporter (DMT)-like permease